MASYTISVREARQELRRWLDRAQAGAEVLIERRGALKNIREAIGLCLEVRAERGLPLTIETQQVEVAV